VSVCACVLTVCVCARARAVLDDDQEWNLLLNFMVPFADMVKTAACPALPQPPQLPEFGTHKVCDFLLLLVNEVSSYYKRVRILDTSGRGGAGGMHARLAFLKAVRQLIDNALRLLTIEPLERM
jgi:arginyl-tRNA synthetase